MSTLNLITLRERVLAADVETRIQVDALLGAPITAEIDAAWLDDKLAGCTPERLASVVAVLFSAFDEPDEDGWSWLGAEEGLEAEAFEDIEAWEASWESADAFPDEDGMQVYTLDHGGCICRGGGAYGGGSHHACRRCGSVAVHACELGAA